MKSLTERKMRFKLLTIFLILAAASFAKEEEVVLVDVASEEGAMLASTFFARAPLDVLDMLRPSARLDMLDYYHHADSLLNVTDALGGKSRLEVVADDYVRVKVTPVSTLEIKILPTKNEPIVMTLYTVGDDNVAKDTRIRFYDSEFKPLAADKYIKVPALKNFFKIKKSDVSEGRLMECMPFQTVAYSTGPGDTPLTATLTTLQTLPDETREILKRIVVESLAATWMSGRYNFK